MKNTRAVLASIGLTALASVGIFATAAGATNNDEGWHTWATTNTSEPTSSTVNWPQSYVGKGQLAPECGVWYQQDRYKETNSKKDDSIADVIADGILTNGEDHHIVQEWRFVYGGDCEPEPEPEVPGVDKWDLNISATCEAVTFSHPKFKVSTDPEYRVDINGVQGERVAYAWGETVTIPAPDVEADTTWEVRIFAKNPALNNAYQQLGSKKAWSKDCEPVVIPEPEQPEGLSGEQSSGTYICADPADGTAIRETYTTPWTQDHVLIEGEWVLGEIVYGDTVKTVEVVADETCDAPTPTPEPEPSQEPTPEPEPSQEPEPTPPTPTTQDTPDTPSVPVSAPVEPSTPDEPTLARTGPESAIPAGLAALAMLGAGIAAVRRARA